MVSLKLMIKNILILFFCLIAFNAEAASRYYVGAGNDWNDNTYWSVETGGAGGASFPIAGDDVFFDANSGDCTLDANAECDSFDTTGYDTTNTFTDAGFSVTMNGNLIIAFVNATVSSTGTWIMNADGNMENGKSGNVLKKLQINDGVTATRVTRLFSTEAVKLGNSSVITGNQSLRINVNADDFIDMVVGGGTPSSILGNETDILIDSAATRSNKAIYLDGALGIYNGENSDLLMTGNWEITGNVLMPSTAGITTEAEAVTLDTNGNNLTVGGYLELGNASDDSPIRNQAAVDFSTGTHSIAGDVYVDQVVAKQTYGYLYFDSSTVTIGGDLILDDADVDFSTATVNIAGDIDFTNNITIDAHTSTINFNGSDQAVDGAGIYYNLSKTFVNLTDNLISYWKLDEASGTLDDAHGSNDGTVTGVDYGATGIVGDCLSFDGAGSVDCGAAADINSALAGDDMTFSMWVKGDNVGGGTTYEALLQKWSSDGDGIRIDFRENGVFRCLMYGNDASEISVSASGYTRDGATWYHLVWVYEPGVNMTVYVDGSYVNQTRETPGDMSGDENFFIGKAESGTVDFTGDIDEVGVWNRALNAGEVGLLYNGGSGLAYPLNADHTLTFDNGSTQTITGLWTLDGLDTDHRINLVSDSPGTAWELDATGSFAIDFVETTDSDASAGDTITYTNTLDGGGNTNWGFGVAAVMHPIINIIW